MTFKNLLWFLLLNLAVLGAGKAEVAELRGFWLLGRTLWAPDPQDDRLITVASRGDRQIVIYIMKPAIPDSPRAGIYLTEKRYFGSRNRKPERATEREYRVRFSARQGDEKFSGVIMLRPFQKASNRLTALIRLPATPLLNLSRPQTVKLGRNFRRP